MEVLLAEENQATREFLCRLLEDNGFIVVTAENGETAWQLLKKNPFRAVVIGDLMSPPLDGIDLIRRLRSASVPIVVMTSYGADYVLLAKMAGARVIIHKFEEPTQIIEIIKETFRPKIETRFVKF